ncbi:MAG: hypothetical protein JWO38_2250 [Gemmataceae bacterium]|nr:hypothetical protein [Gemmataceae bacterium]
MTRIGLASAVLTAAFVAPPGRADPPTPTRLTNDGLVKMLTKLGYETRALGKTSTEVIVDRPGWQSVISAHLSTDGTRIWLDAWFVTVTRPEDVPAATWKKILARNEDVSPAVFSLNPKSKRLFLSLAVPNEDVTPAALRKEVEYLDTQIEKTQDVWKLANFVPPMTAEGRKRLDPLAGTWTVTEFVDEGKPLDSEEAAGFKLTVDGERFRFVKGEKTTIRSGQLVTGTAGGKPTLDRYTTGGSVRGIFKLDDDTLTWCFSAGDRPTRFAGDEKTRTTLLVLKRAK